MVKSKYSNDFLFGNNIVSCKWCDYKRDFKAGDSTCSLRSHLENHHKDRLELLSKVAEEKTKAISAAKLAVGDLRKRISQESLEKQLYVHHNTLLLGFD